MSTKKAAKKSAPVKKAAPKKAAPKKTAPKKKKISIPKETGFEGALKERKEHFTKHGFDVSHDDGQVNGELLQKAKFALTMDDRFYPPNIGQDFRNAMSAKGHAERLDVAMSLIAAERSRINRSEMAAKRTAKKKKR
jgi:hypothetical protein